MAKLAVTAAPKAYSYTRFSTDEQKHGDSLRRQSALATAYALKHGLDLDTTLTFEDAGVSGYHNANVETGRLGDFLEAVRIELVPQGSYLLVESLDRISRTAARKAVRILESIVDAGITLVTLTDNREHTAESLDANPMDFLLAFLVFVRSNEESQQKSHRLRAAWERKRAVAGNKPLTKICPAWLSLVDGEFVVNEERANVVRRVYADTLMGSSPHSISLAFNVEGIPVWGRGTEWHRSYILKLLESEATVGRMIPHTMEYDKKTHKRSRKPQPALVDYFPSIIDEQVFQRVKSLRRVTVTDVATGKTSRVGAMSPMRGMHSGNEVRNIFGGLGRCARCGGTLTRTNKGKGVQVWEYLICRGKNGSGCVYDAIPYGAVERAFLANVEDLIASVPTKGNSKAIDKEIRETENSLHGVDDAMEKLLDASGRTPSIMLTRKIADLTALQSSLSARLSELAELRAETSGVLVRSKLDDLQRIADHTPLDRTKLNAILRQSLDSVTVDSTEGSLILKWKHGGESEVYYRQDAEHFGFTRGSQLVAPKRSTRVTKGKRKATTKETR